MTEAPEKPLDYETWGREGDVTDICRVLQNKQVLQLKGAQLRVHIQDLDSLLIVQGW